MRVAVIGGGLAGLSCTIRLAQKGAQVTLFEAAPELGGRTRSFFDRTTGTWVDNGPHLLIGAYHATRSLLREADATENVEWQPHLQLPLWDRNRGSFTLSLNGSLPFALAMPLACYRLPGHGITGLSGIMRLARAIRRSVDPELSVASWLEAYAIPSALRRDMLDPLCLGAMNELPATANAMSFAQVLREAFSGHRSARLGWFRMPLSEGLIRPLERLALDLGAQIRKRARIQRLDPASSHIDLETPNGMRQRFDAAVVALPGRASDALLGRPQGCETRAITNIHLWFEEPLRLPHPLIGGIDTYGQWFFDVTRQMKGRQMEEHHAQASHLCAVISADREKMPAARRVGLVCDELREILGREASPVPFHHRIVREHHATTLVRRTSKQPLPPHLIDASEQPEPGDLPATIEWAVQRGERAAATLLARHSDEVIHSRNRSSHFVTDS